MMASGVPVDELDLGIVRELIVGNHSHSRPNRVTLEEMAGRLGVHVNTVASRMRRLERAQLFLPLTLQVTPALGMNFASAFFAVAPGTLTVEARTALLAVPGAHLLVEFVEGVIISFFAPERKEVEDAITKAAAILGTPVPACDSAAWEHWILPDRVQLKTHDVAILSHLVRDPRMSLAAIARDVGISKRSVELRLEAMRRANGIAMMGGGQATPEGMVLAHILVDVPKGPESKPVFGALMASLPNYLYRTMFPGRFAVGIFARTMAQIMDQVAAVRGIPGVSNLRLLILSRWIVNPAFANYLPKALARIQARDSRPETSAQVVEKTSS